MNKKNNIPAQISRQIKINKQKIQKKIQINK